jgi:micrococcal nuclease
MGSFWGRKIFYTAFSVICLFQIWGCASGVMPVNSGADLEEVIRMYPELADKKVEESIVARVVDGDTFETDLGQKVRLIGVNTPEKFGKAQYYGIEASQFTKEQLEGQKVYMFKDVSETDKYGRLLRYVFIKGNTVMYNETLLQEGFANVMTYPPDVMFAKKFVIFEREARTNNTGLWGHGEEAVTQKEDAASHEASCANPEIKGNINSRNDKIYHIPSGRSYNQTKEEVLFCTEEEAIAAGFRKAAH